MKNLLRSFVALLPCVAISGCELLCQAGTGTCGMSDEQMDKLLHPKTYGEYFVKPGMMKEGWRQDWVACGGMKDGGYASDAPSGSTSIILRTAETKKRNELSLCMQSKGYEFRREP